MPQYARYRHEGDEHIRHTPGSDVAASVPILVGSNYWGVSSLDISAGTQGDLRVSGVFRGLKTNASDAFSVGDLVDFTPSQGFAAGSSWRVREDSASGDEYVLVEINPPGAGGGGTSFDEVLINNGPLSGATNNYEIAWDYTNKVLYGDNGSNVWEIIYDGTETEVLINNGALAGSTNGYKWGWDYAGNQAYADDGGGNWEAVPSGGDEVLISASALSGSTGGYEVGWNYTDDRLHFDNGAGTWEEFIGNEVLIDIGPISIGGPTNNYRLVWDYTNKILYGDAGDNTWEVIYEIGGADDEVLINNGALSGATGGYEVGWDYANNRLYFDNGSNVWEEFIGEEVLINNGALSGSTNGYRIGWDYAGDTLYADNGAGTWEEISTGGAGGGRKDDQESLVFSPTLAVDFDAGNYDNKSTTMTANMTPTFASTRGGGVFCFVVTQDATGGRTITWPVNVLWPGSDPQPNPAANAVTVFQLYFDGTNFHGLS